MSIQGMIRDEMQKILTGALEEVLPPLIARLEALEASLSKPVPSPEPWPDQPDGTDDVADLVPEPAPRKRAPRKTSVHDA